MQIYFITKKNFMAFFRISIIIQEEIRQILSKQFIMGKYAVTVILPESQNATLLNLHTF